MYKSHAQLSWTHPRPVRDGFLASGPPDGSNFDVWHPKILVWVLAHDVVGSHGLSRFQQAPIVVTVYSTIMARGYQAPLRELYEVLGHAVSQVQGFHESPVRVTRWLLRISCIAMDTSRHALWHVIRSLADWDSVVQAVLGAHHLRRNAPAILRCALL